MPGDDLVASAFVAGFGRGKRRLGVADMLLALGAQLLDQRRAVAFEARVLDAGAPAALAALATAASSSR